jgi:hypothetical protein
MKTVWRPQLTRREAFQQIGEMDDERHSIRASVE